MERTTLTVVYDERCAFCRRCRDWLADQPVLVEMELLGAGTPEARRRFGHIPVRASELVVVDERGRIWVGPAAFEMCLWATAKYRSARLSDVTAQVVGVRNRILRDGVEATRQAGRRALLRRL